MPTFRALNLVTVKVTLQKGLPKSSINAKFPFFKYVKDKLSSLKEKEEGSININSIWEAPQPFAMNPK